MKKKSEFDKEMKKIQKKVHYLQRKNFSDLGYEYKENSCEVIYGTDIPEMDDAAVKCHGQ